MDACMSVEKEVDRVVNKLKNLRGSMEAGIDEQIAAIEKLQKDLSEENVREAYSTIQKWIKTIPRTLADLKKNGTEEDLRNYQIQIKMVLNKLEEIQTDLDNGNESS